MPHETPTEGRPNVEKAQEYWELPTDITENSNTYKLLKGLLESLETVDDEILSVYHAHHINFAEGETLDKFGRLIGLSRKTYAGLSNAELGTSELGNGFYKESDERYRTRIKAEFSQGRVNVDYTSFAEFIASVLDTDGENITLVTPPDAPYATVIVQADPAIYEGIGFNSSEIVDLFGDAVPAGHEVTVQATGTFRLKSDGETDDADAGLTSDSISTGGTLATDL